MNSTSDPLTQSQRAQTSFLCKLNSFQRENSLILQSYFISNSFTINSNLQVQRNIISSFSFNFNFASRQETQFRI